MGVDAVLQPDIDGLCVPAADRGRAGDMIGPFGIDNDVAVAVAHFGMDEAPVGIAHQHGQLEAESGLEPGQGGAWIFIENA
jgi:hypothetical protein